MLCLSQHDILKAVSLNEVMDVIETALKLDQTGQVFMPPRSHIDYGGGTLLLMPCFTKQSFGTKLVTVFPENASKNAPAVTGVVVLNDAETGVPTALIDGRILTAIRTGAVGGVSIRHLASDDAKTLGVVGAGLQGYYQALCAMTARNIDDLFIYDLFEKNLNVFSEKVAEEFPEVKVHKAASTEELLEASDIVITTTTAKEPVLPNKKDLFAGKHFIGVGSFQPHVQEYPKAVFDACEQVFIDTEHALEETGDLIIPLKEGWVSRDQIITMGSLLVNGLDTTELKKKTTFFKSVGMAAFDLLASQLVYEKAKAKGLGYEFTM